MLCWLEKGAPTTLINVSPFRSSVDTMTYHLGLFAVVALSMNLSHG